VFLCIIRFSFGCHYQCSQLPGKTHPWNDVLLLLIGMLNPTHSLTHSTGLCVCVCVCVLVISESCLSRNCFSSASVDIITNAAAAAESHGCCYKNNITQVERCCHSECLGGCSGSSSAECFACVHVFHDGRCWPRCPRDFYQVTSLDYFVNIRQTWITWLIVRNQNNFCIDYVYKTFTVIHVLYFVQKRYRPMLWLLI